MRSWLRLFPLAVLLGGTVASAASWTVASESNFPPYCFNKKGVRSGIDVEIVEAVLTSMGINPRHRAAAWPEVVTAVEQGQAEVGIQFVWSKEREEKLALIGPHRVGQTVLLVRDGDKLVFDSMASLHGKRVGVVQGFKYLPEFDADEKIKKLPAANNLQLLRRLVNKRVDVIIGDRDSLAALAQIEGSNRLVRVLEKPLAEVPRFIAMPKGTPERDEKVARFKKAYEAVVANGTVEKILAKYRQPPQR
jgi:polar amino acid transport system substrate-binding protein